MIAVATRRLAAATATLCTVLGGVALGSPNAQADDSSTLTVLGTSDVFDSFLVQSVLKPGFEKAHPGVTLNYVASGSAQAIAKARAGGGSALLVHAASLENQFVADGYSADNAPGRAVFYGDFILAGQLASGQKSDPAGVLSSGAVSHDVVSAFKKVAAAGEAKRATFVSRNTGSGTDVAEHQIWALVGKSNTDPALHLCTLSSAVGGGQIPIGDPSQAGPSGQCPTSNQIYPDWYKFTALKQGANVQAADTCSMPSFPNGGCYVFTDRGTYQYLQSQKLLTSLQTVVRDNAASAPGGVATLTNTFHAYAINPAKFPKTQLNTTAAKQFLDYLTLPATQAAVGNYLADSAGGAPFLPDAAPAITTTRLPARVNAGERVTIAGNVRNVVPGTPALAGVKVSLLVTPFVNPRAPYVGATSTTNAAGNYSLPYVPLGAARYTVTASASTRKEYTYEGTPPPPAFYDQLTSATGATSAPVAVQSSVRLISLGGRQGYITGTVHLSPAVNYQDGTLRLYSTPQSSGASTLRYVKSIPITRGQSTVSYRFTLPHGRKFVQLRYYNSAVVLTGATGVHKVTVS